jgi:molecular chaperone GrpE
MILKQGHHWRYPNGLFQTLQFSSLASPPETDSAIPEDKTKSPTEIDTQARTTTSNAAGSINERKRRQRKTAPKRTKLSDSDEEDELSRDDLLKLVARKEELLKNKHKEIEKMQTKGFGKLR